MALADEEGYVSIVDTSANELPPSTHGDPDHRPRAQWLAHRNTVFDLAWARQVGSIDTF